MQTRRAALVSLIALGTVLVLPFGCKGKEGATGGGGTAGDSGSGDILVGEYGSMTGLVSAFGKSTDEGIQLAVDEINKAGGINNRKIKIVGPEDTESAAAKGQVAVKRLVEKNVVAVLGEVSSGISLAGGPVCQNAQVPMISPSSTNPQVTKIGDYIFRVCFTDLSQSAVIAKFAKDSLHANSAAIFYASDVPYSVGIKDEFTKNFTARGGKVIAETSYVQSDKDFKAPLTKLKASSPDVILVPGYYSDAGSICKQARDLGITVPILGGDGWDNAEFHTYAGNAITNCFFSDHASMDDPNPVIQTFVKAYTAKYGKAPDSLAALGYDSMNVLAAAIKKSKSLKGPDLRDAIAQTKDFGGVTGSITINANRDADKGAVIMEVANGKFKFKEAIAKP
jgi:branched-chain amino acid transport system substrate-binding protein